MDATKTSCKCAGPAEGERMFFCERHQCHKTKPWQELCATHPKYFQAWEEGHGPGQISENAISQDKRHFAFCIHRGALLLSIPCKVGRNRVFHCTHFDKPITNKPLSLTGAEYIHDHKTIAVPDRNCDECGAKELSNANSNRT